MRGASRLPCSGLQACRGRRGDFSACLGQEADRRAPQRGGQAVPVAGAAAATFRPRQHASAMSTYRRRFWRYTSLRKAGGRRISPARRNGSLLWVALRPVLIPHGRSPKTCAHTASLGVGRSDDTLRLLRVDHGALESWNPRPARIERPSLPEYWSGDRQSGARSSCLVVARAVRILALRSMGAKHGMRDAVSTEPPRIPGSDPALARPRMRPAHAPGQAKGRCSVRGRIDDGGFMRPAIAGW